MRECPECECQSRKSNFYTLYNEWRKDNFTEGKPSRKQWEDMINADKQIDYESISIDEKDAPEEEESMSEDSGADHEVSVREKDDGYFNDMFNY